MIKTITAVFSLGLSIYTRQVPKLAVHMADPNSTAEIMPN